jgi:hypothetical protein
MLAHLEQALVAIDFLDPQAPKKLMPRLNQLFNRAQPTPEEIHILRGVAKAMLPFYLVSTMPWVWWSVKPPKSATDARFTRA